MIKTLERAGANVMEQNLQSYYNYNKFGKREEWWKKEMKNIYKIKYDKASPSFVILNWIEWSGTIQIDKNKKILELGTYKGRAY